MIFRIILWFVGCALSLGSRASGRVRAQLARDLSMVVTSDDGVARTFVVAGRRWTSHAGALPHAACTVVFRSADQGARIFLAPDAIGRIVDGVGDRSIVCHGDAALVLWFYEMTMGLLPWRRPSRDVMPDAYVESNRNGKAADRITREPAVTALDPAWTGAVAQRENLLIWHVGCGAVLERKFKRHEIVIAVPVSPAGSES